MKRTSFRGSGAKLSKIVGPNRMVVLEESPLRLRRVPRSSLEKESYSEAFHRKLDRQKKSVPSFPKAKESVVVFDEDVHTCDDEEENGIVCVCPMDLPETNADQIDFSPDETLSCATSSSSASGGGAATPQFRIPSPSEIASITKQCELREGEKGYSCVQKASPNDVQLSTAEILRGLVQSHKKDLNPLRYRVNKVKKYS